MNKKNILIFIIVFLLLNFTMSMCRGGDQSADLTQAGDFGAASTKKEYEQDEAVAVKIRNNTAADYVIKNKCPSEPLAVSAFRNGQWEANTSVAEIKCDKTADITVKAGQEVTVHFVSWNHALFGSLGRYKVTATLEPAVADASIKPVTVESNEFEVKNKGIMGFLWTAAFFQPIYNILVLLVKYVPFHDLGLAIILLTIIIRTILLVPSQKGLKSQRKMQELQPKLASLKEKYKDNQEALAKETMMLWKEHKVNPFGSCLPLLIQFPVLIALFYVIQNGLNPDNSYLLYGPLKDFSVSVINVNFLGILDLTAVNAVLLPLFVGSLQFLQMKLSMLKKEKAKEGKKPEKEQKNEMESANQMMVYVMPVMIAVFTASVPAGVGLYWSVSTLYGIVQQIIVNRQVSAETAKVRVIN